MTTTNNLEFGTGLFDLTWHETIFTLIRQIDRDLSRACNRPVCLGLAADLHIGMDTLNLR